MSSSSSSIVLSKDYNKIIKSKLNFKGNNNKKSSSSSSSSSIAKRKYEDNDDTIKNNNNEENKDNEDPTFILEERPGLGRITSSGTTVHGHFTEFMNQLSVGDAIIINHPNTLQEETKVIRMVLSNMRFFNNFSIFLMAFK